MCVFDEAGKAMTLFILECGLIKVRLRFRIEQHFLANYLESEYSLLVF